MHRTDAAVLALALLGVLLLSGLARWTEPDLVALADAGAHEGARVAVEGRVLRFAPGARAAFVTLAHDGARLDGFAPPDAPLARGDVVRAVGVVARGDRTMVLSIERAIVVEPAASRAVEVAALATRPADYDGARVLVHGEARQGALAGDDLRVAVRGAPAPSSGWWLAEGDFGYHDKSAAYVLDVVSWRATG